MYNGMFDELKEAKHFKEITGLKNPIKVTDFKNLIK